MIYHTSELLVIRDLLRKNINDMYTQKQLMQAVAHVVWGDFKIAEYVGPKQLQPHFPVDTNVNFIMLRVVNHQSVYRPKIM